MGSCFCAVNLIRHISLSLTSSRIYQIKMMKYMLLLLPTLACAANVQDPVVGRIFSEGSDLTPAVDGVFDVSNENGRFALSTGFDFNDMTGYFFNAMIIISVLLLVSN